MFLHCLHKIYSIFFNIEVISIKYYVIIIFVDVLIVYMQTQTVNLSTFSETIITLVLEYLYH